MCPKEKVGVVNVAASGFAVEIAVNCAREGACKPILDLDAKGALKVVAIAGTEQSWSG